MNIFNPPTIARAALYFMVSLGPHTLLAQAGVGDQLSDARSNDGRFISWQEHIVDDAAAAGFALTGGDGLVMGDVDKDGYEDIVTLRINAAKRFYGG